MKYAEFKDANMMFEKLLKNNLLLLYFVCFTIYILTTADSYPVESKPLNNNPETWFGDEWVVFSSRGSEDPSTSRLVGNDPHVKKSKITPKSIFIAPNTYNQAHQDCPSGYRVDHNGKCIKVVKINQDELLAARISELFGIDDNTKKSDSDDAFTDYYDTDTDDGDSKNKKISISSGPLQINLPLTIDLEEENIDDGKRVKYIIVEKIVDHDDFSTTSIPLTSSSVEIPDETTTVVTTSVVTPITTSVVTPVTIRNPMTTTEESITSTAVTNIDESITRTSHNPSTDNDNIEHEMTTEETINTYTNPSAIEETTTSISLATSISTQKPLSTTKTFSVDFLPKSYRKSSINRQQSISNRLKNYRDRLDKADRPRKYNNTTKASTTDLESHFSKIDRKYLQRPNINILQPTTEKSAMSTTLTSRLMIATTVKPFWWLPRGWSVQESKDNPTLVRFWTQQPLLPDERARSHAPRQRANSRMPTDNIFSEISLTEINEMLKEK